MTCKIGLWLALSVFFVSGCSPSVNINAHSDEWIKVNKFSAG